jgi:glycosyltransferase involved in cell wall biosynthesis
MRILLVHNYYQRPGGEDAVFAAETALLRQKGCDVVEYVEDNRRIIDMRRLSLAAGSIWSSATRRRLLETLRRTQPHVVHFHNIFPLISPSAYWACRESGVPIVQTLHNYRLLCPAGTLFRNGGVCEDCLGKTPPWPGVLHRCYRQSCAQTAASVAMLTVHRWQQTWQRHVDIYIALTEFVRNKFVEAGFPAEKIVVKPNFVQAPPRAGAGAKRYALFAGRIAPEKGVRTLLRGWQHVNNIDLKIVGDGPLLDEVRRFVQTEKLAGVETLAQRPHHEVVDLMAGARFLVVPSEWYETFGLVIIEAFACGVPVIASRLGAMAEIVEGDRTGLLFKPGDPQDLANKVHWAVEHPDAMARMGETARRVYERKYTPERNYEMLRAIYDRAIEEATRKRRVN